MPSIPLHVTSRPRVTESQAQSPLPTLLETPTGLAILELQGTINLPSNAPKDDADNDQLQIGTQLEIPVGRLVFPDYKKSDPPSNTAWMKRVYLYVGRHQRLTGEVKKLAKPLAIIRRRTNDEKVVGNTEGAGVPDSDIAATGVDEQGHEELEVVEVIRYRILFSSRPEPVSGNV